jgi:hypothetical protein
MLLKIELKMLWKLLKKWSKILIKITDYSNNQSWILKPLWRQDFNKKELSLMPMPLLKKLIILLAKLNQVCSNLEETPDLLEDSDLLETLNLFQPVLMLTTDGTPLLDGLIPLRVSLIELYQLFKEDREMHKMP